jgi:hypothetical protein
MLDRMYYRQWTLMALTEEPRVCRRPKSSVRRRLWVWFWRQCMPPHTGYSLRKEGEDGEALAQTV